VDVEADERMNLFHDLPSWLVGPTVRHRAGCDPGGQKGHVIWPSAKEGKVSLTPAQLAMMLEGIDWRTPQRTWQPSAAG
jgi:transposase